MAYFPYVIFVSVVSLNDVMIPAFCFCLSLKLYLNSLVYHRNIFGSSSKVFGNHRKSSDIFGNVRKFSENVRKRSSGLRNNFGNLRKSSEGGRQSSENHQKRRHQHVYIIKRTLHGDLKINLVPRVSLLCLPWSLEERPWLQLVT